MNHCTLGVADFQFRHAFRALIPDSLLRRALRHHTARTFRDRRLPARHVLAGLVAWFFAPTDKLPAVLAWLCKRPTDLPADAAIYRARDRIGLDPIRWLRQQVIRPLAQPRRDADAFYDGRRLLAIDGTVLTVADTPANDAAFGRSLNQKRASGFPLLRVVALCEVGTHALLDWETAGYGTSEQALATRLYGRVPPKALLLADRNFHCYGLWQAAGDGRFDLLIRVQSGPKFTPHKELGDGSWLSRVYPRRGKGKKERAIEVRVIAYSYTDDKGVEQRARLLTSLLDAARHPAQVLVALYHRRWEQEGVFKEIKGTLGARVTHLRAHAPERVLQELEGLLLGHYVVRQVILETAREQGVSAIAISFTGALRVLRTRLAGATGSRRRGQRRRGKRRGAKGRGAQRRGGVGDWWQQLKKELGREVLQKRRKRCCPHKVKVTRVAWQPKRPEDKEHPVPTFKIVPAPPG